MANRSAGAGERRSWGARPRGGTCVPLTREVLVLLPGSGHPWGALPGVRQGPACPFQAGEAPHPRKPVVNGTDGGRWSPLPPGLPESLLKPPSAVLLGASPSSPVHLPGGEFASDTVLERKRREAESRDRHLLSSGGGEADG